MNTILDYLKGALSKNFPTMVVLAIVWYNLHTQINEITTSNAVRTVVIDDIWKDIDDLEAITKSTVTRLSTLEQKVSFHMGEAYLRDEEEDN